MPLARHSGVPILSLTRPAGGKLLASLYMKSVLSYNHKVYFSPPAALTGISDVAALRVARRSIERYRR